MTTPSHGEVQELLGAWVDGELPEQSAARVRRHVDRCDACRRALEIQRSVRARVRSLPVPAAPAAMNARLAALVDSVPRVPRQRERSARRRAWVGRAFAVSGWVVAAVVASITVTRPSRLGSAGNPHPPMVTSAVADFRRAMAREFPRACDPSGAPDLPFQGAPLRVADARPLSCWSTTLQGQAAAAWAYRWRDRIVVAYVVPESLFFRQPAVREAVRREGRYLAADGGEGVVAWAAEDRGILVVGDAAPAELELLRL